MAEVAKQNKDIFLKVLLTTVIIRIGIEGARLFLPELLAVWLTVLLGMLLSYWIPPIPDMRYLTWIRKSWRTAAIAFMIATVYVLVSDRLKAF